MWHRSLAEARCAALCLTLLAAGCSCGSNLIEGDAAIPPDPGADSGVPAFADGSGIARTGLELARVSPGHGPFTGGNRVVLRGNGFTDEAQVSFGGSDVQPADHRLIDARRLEVVVPAGDVGSVDVSVTVGSDTATLDDGYTYDALQIDPTSGATSGGTFVTIIGSGTAFADGDRVTFGEFDCRDIDVVSPTTITCRTPPSGAGTVDVSVIDGEDDTSLTIADGFTYFDSADPFAGGLGGGPISGTINLTVIDAFTGAPVPLAYAIVGEDLTTPHQTATDILGQATFSGPDIIAPVTIHVAKHCYEKTSVVAFDASNVTVFLVPWMDPMCGMGMGELPPSRGRNGSFIQGELVWTRDFGLGPGEWVNVPRPRAGWVRVAYVYTTVAMIGSNNPDPAAGGSRQRVLESGPTGERGYPYSIFARPAGLAVYALAGLEETATGRFIPYVMGVRRNVLAAPGQTLYGQDIPMDIPLDHALQTQLTELPSATPIGPDRFRLQANIDLAGEGVIVREVNYVELDVLRARDASRPFRFLAQPALTGSLADGRYRVEAGWYTGDFDLAPYTVVVQRGVTQVDDTLEMGGFLGVPEPTAPMNGAPIPGDRILRWEADGAEPDLQVLIIVGADNNPAWRMFLPGNVREAPIPDLSSIPTIDDITPGTFTWGIFAIGIPSYDFNEFRYSDLNDFYWTRWASGVYTGLR